MTRDKLASLYDYMKENDIPKRVKDEKTKNWYCLGTLQGMRILLTWAILDGSLEDMKKCLNDYNDDLI